MRTIFVFLAVLGSSSSAHASRTMLLRDLDTGAEIVDDAALSKRGFLPCSTFKIPNTLIGLSTGVISGEAFSLPWDHVQRHIETWNRDQTLASALKESVVWFYQEIARRIGATRMDKYVRAFHYGNESTCCQIDRFWLDGKLRISPAQQVDFLEKMAKHTLPEIKPEHTTLVRKLITLESTSGYTIEGKSGSGTQEGQALSWLVGFVDTPTHHYAYAFLDVTPGKDWLSRERRLELVRGWLVEHHVISPG